MAIYYHLIQKCAKSNKLLFMHIIQTEIKNIIKKLEKFSTLLLTLLKRRVY